jgi:hypothetical protein
MSAAQLDALVSVLTPALAQQREKIRHERRGSERRRRRGTGAKDKVSDADRILATVLCLRKIGTHDLLARLCEPCRRARSSSSSTTDTAPGERTGRAV